MNTLNEGNLKAELHSKKNMRQCCYNFPHLYFAIKPLNSFIDVRTNIDCFHFFFEITKSTSFDFYICSFEMCSGKATSI